MNHDMRHQEIPDLLTVRVPPGGRVLVVSDLHLPRRATSTSTATVAELAHTLEAWVGAGVVVFAGDILELLADPDPDAGACLAAHPELAVALDGFAGAGEREVVYLPGNHDGRVAWDPRAAEAVRATMHADLALAADLELATGSGLRRVRVEHGNQLDPSNAFADPRNPTDTPLGHHVVLELLPALPDRPWLDGVEYLADPVSLPVFLVSRVAYRKVARWAGWILLPLLLVALVRAPLTWELLHRGQPDGLEWLRRATIVTLAVIGDVFLVAIGLMVAGRRAWRSLGELAIGKRGLAQNDAARDAARDLVAEGWSGLITGHTHHPELRPVGDGFYANSGCGSAVVDASPARFGFPPVYLASRRLSWVELEAGADLHVRLLDSRVELPGGSALERLVSRRPEPSGRGPARPSVVAAYPQGPSWPPVAIDVARQRRVRRLAATAIGFAGLLDVASAVTPPLRDRLHIIVDLVPLAVPQAAAALVALAGLGLMSLARGVRRGQRSPWALAVGLLAGSVVLHLLKGGDIEESITAGAVCLYLLRHRRDFTAEVDRGSLVRGVRALVVGGVVAAALGTVAAATIGHLGLASAAAAATERLVGISQIRLPDHLDDFLTPVLAAVGFGLFAAAGWLAFRPVVRRQRDRTAIEQARAIVHRYGGDTLAYFALREDKEHFFSGDSVVAYAVYGGVCLVSPDPIGPPGEREAVWGAFRRFADEHGWTVAVMAAAEEWLPVYRDSGMHDLYVGDEAVVDCRTFRLDGGDRKGLRQAVNRIARNGYTIEFHRPADLSPTLRAGLARIMTESRRGDVERGFSMTLGRAFDPTDHDLLLAVAFGPDGAPAAFCQYVPAPAIEGWSLDLMRRSDAEHPNGVTDFVVVRTLEWMKEQGYHGLGLNFATMRAVIAGEAGDSLPQRVERWLLKRMSDSMQIESLWKYNAKFGPKWRPRYAVYDSPEHILPAALAVARAESFWELPLIGRFLQPGEDRGTKASDLPV